MAPRSEDLKAAVQSLVRVRAAESRDADGLRQVWHQGANGADLLSHADTDGKLVRQELTLLGHCFLWTEKGLRTGQVLSGEGSSAGLASDAVRLDDSIDPERIRLASKALAEYDGPDKYIRHMKQEIDYLAAGFVEREQIVVTATGPGVDKKVAEARVPRPAKRLSLLWLAVAGVGVGVALTVALLLLMH